MPGYQRRLFSHAAADFDLLVKRLQAESLKWPGRQKALYLPGARAAAAVLLALLQTANLATGYAHITVTELAARCGLRTEGKAGHKSHCRALRAILKLAKQAGFIEYDKAGFDEETHRRDPALILVRPEFFIFMGAKKAELAKEMEKARRKALTAHKRRAENLECAPLSDDPAQAIIDLCVEQWAGYNKVRKARAQKKKNRLRHAYTRALKSSSGVLAAMVSSFARIMSPRGYSTGEKIRAARNGQGLLFDPPDGALH